MMGRAMRINLLEALSDNISIDYDKCTFCGICVETCVLDNLRLKLAPCRQGCPLGVNVQGYVQEVLRGNDDKAREILRETLIFPEILGRICPAPCESHCHHGVVDGQAVAARAIKRYLTDGQTAADIPIPDPKADTGKKVGIIGAGPAGLQAAHDLRMAGHAVVVYDAADRPGGMLRWAIPEFRLPLEVLERELTLLEKIGVEFVCGTSLDKEKIQELKEKFDAVIMSVGCPRVVRLGVEGEDLEGVVYGLDLLKEAKEGSAREMPGRVVVIGGGNLAVDAAETAKRLGATDVRIICLEEECEMPAFPGEVKLAREEGIGFEHRWGPVRFIERDGHVAGVELQQCLGVFDQQGAFKPRFDACVLNTVEADAVIVAIGQRRDDSLVGIPENVDPLTLRQGESNLFWAGDCLTGPSSVVKAMSGGRQAALSVDRLLAGEHLKYGRSYPGPVEKEFEIDTSRGTDAPRVTPPRRSSAGQGDFGELEKAISGEAARSEAGRCYSCGGPFGKFRTCWFCLPCEVECPNDALWVQIPYLLR